MPKYEFEDVPGFDRILEIAEDSLEPEIITRMPPMDLSYIRDAGARALVALAVSAKWNVVRKPTRPLTLIARDGTKLQLATDTSLRFSVFSQRVHAIGRHSQDVTLTDSLIEDIIKTTKLGHSHAKVLRDLPRTKMPPEDVMPSPEAIIETFSDEEPAGDCHWCGRNDNVGFVVDGNGDRFFYCHRHHDEAMALVEEAPTGNPVEPDPTIVRVEPTLNRVNSTQAYVSPIMETVIRQLVSDGDEQITYRCLLCGLEHPSKRGVGSHYQLHVQAGEAESTANHQKVIVDFESPKKKEPEPEPEPVADFYTWRNEQVKVDERQPAPLIDQIANMIRALIFQETEALEAENDRLRQRNESLEASLNALYELLGEIREPRS